MEVVVQTKSHDVYAREIRAARHRRNKRIVHIQKLIAEIDVKIFGFRGPIIGQPSVCLFFPRAVNAFGQRPAIVQHVLD
jgi:hypothetical protein